ncbi:ribosomal maturation YjgA family protein [Maribacter hydrothermalis]|uniref:DUF2809 domain-containing protein n=1 Tax=Maribacter hydrothermalis TaxID=1836467 RepID=A0A1B7Z0Z7_9FLAO|nr:DUF2809 domain-containing protein [Maribacter hydrothermalis]APQ18047.1 hypothetical protein BTR34_12240 [Maribacter hydrothermalis]OBR36392.1 hypothetical protein A9200_08130 [Maribacter hydrothermalis]
MKFKFHKTYFTAFILLFAIEVSIAVFLESGFIRHTFGDYLVVILLFCFFKSFLRANDLVVGMATLSIAFVIEFLQLTPFLEYLGLQQNKWANLIFGNVFSIQDLIAYTLGILTVTYLEIRKQFLLIN